MERGFMGELFNMDFTSFITVRLIKVLFILSIVVFGLIGLGMLISGFGMMAFSKGTGLMTIVLAPIVFFIGVIYSRMFLELAIVLFRIESNTAVLKKDNAA